MNETADVPPNMTAVAPGKLGPVKVTLVPPPVGPVFGETAITVGRAGAPATVTDADAVPPAPLSVAVTLPVVLSLRPPLVPVTLTAKVQDVLAASAAPDRLTPLLPAVAVMVPPPHDPVRPLGVETTRPAGNVSVNATPDSAAAPLLS